MRQGNTLGLTRVYVPLSIAVVEGIWKPWGLLYLFQTGLPEAEEISL